MSLVITPLLVLQATLKRRYPGLRVEAYIQQRSDEKPFRTLVFYGPRAALLAYGLATESAKTATGDLIYRDGLGSCGGGGKGSREECYICHHLVLEGETATPSLSRKFPTKRLEADVRRICKRLSRAEIAKR